MAGTVKYLCCSIIIHLDGFKKSVSANHPCRVWLINKRDISATERVSYCVASRSVCLSKICSFNIFLLAEMLMFFCALKILFSLSFDDFNVSRSFDLHQVNDQLYLLHFLRLPMHYFLINFIICDF